jgi:creatinine amidohydrolase
MEMIPAAYDLSRMTSEELAAIIDGANAVVILPVGAVEPHGPHLGLGTDNVISVAAAIRAAELLANDGFAPLIAPAVPYGVTDCASAFKGAVSVSAGALTAYLHSLIEGFLTNGVVHVCLVNNHLEPAQVRAVSAAIDGLPPGSASVACPVTRRWAKTLDDEFKSGACHAGSYETSIVMESAPELVRDDKRRQLPEVPVSLSEKLNDGVTDFVDMGLDKAYAGAPAAASAAHGGEQLTQLAEMIATEIREALNP